MPVVITAETVFSAAHIGRCPYGMEVVSPPSGCMSVCLSVCLSVRAYVSPYARNCEILQSEFTKFRT